ncbi:hypothetical protein INH39_21885 [Massilia violaceinigra]|uniref:Uncharacterized protein n=1 Tax=Massilia violaceinigra TaxID=2045208 RepID=A0ABY4A3G0_9BURK|nr:hypothetical protein [Massilia violaceinigra]UOD28106.1 hypothetical protein INH39_21885 [Massilia violaceinigra]
MVPSLMHAHGRVVPSRPRPTLHQAYRASLDPDYIAGLHFYLELALETCQRRMNGLRWAPRVGSWHAKAGYLGEYQDAIGQRGVPDSHDTLTAGPREINRQQRRIVKAEVFKHRDAAIRRAAAPADAAAKSY